MSKKPYKLGVIVGRFQTFHAGHEEIISKAIELCEQVGVFIGSSQESGTLKNPFSYETRKRILTTVFDDEINIYPLPDIGVGNNSAWGDYVLKNVYKRFNQAPDLLVSGKESRRIDWFDSLHGPLVAELYVPKTIDVSATQMRSHLINGEIEEWKKYTNPRLWNEYEELRKTVYSCKDNLETDSI